MRFLPFAIVALVALPAFAQQRPSDPALVEAQKEEAIAATQYILELRRAQALQLQKDVAKSDETLKWVLDNWVAK